MPEIEPGGPEGWINDQSFREFSFNFSLDMNFPDIL